MMSPLLLPLRRPLPLILGFSSPFLVQPLVSRPMRLEGPAAAKSYSHDARVPVWKNGGVNPAAYGQISTGSVLGLVAGVGVSLFSKPLAIVLGLAIMGIQYLASMGIHVVPRKRIQRYVKGIDLRAALEDNMAFKFAFGATFLLAACAEF